MTFGKLFTVASLLSFFYLREPSSVSCAHLGAFDTFKHAAYLIFTSMMLGAMISVIVGALLFREE